jgi:hypothetical protein
MRLKSALWVAAYIRGCQNAGVFVAIRQRGAEEAGAIFIKINRLDARAELFGPAPQSVFDEGHPMDRAFTRIFGETPAEESVVEERLAREMTYDPDLWIIEVEDREGRNFLEWVTKE